MKRILIIANLFGNNRQGYDLASILRERGHDVRLVQFLTSTDARVGCFGVPYIRPHGIFSKFHVLRNIFAIASKAIFYRCDSVVCIGSVLLPLALLIKICNRAHLIYYSLEYCRYKYFMRGIIRHNVEKYIDVEENRQKKVYEEIGIKVPYLVVYNMPLLSAEKYDNGGLRSLLKDKYGLSGSEKIVLYAGSYQRYACIETIIEASKLFSDGVVFVCMMAWGMPHDLKVDSRKCIIVPPKSGREYFDCAAEADAMLLPYESLTDFNVLNCSPQKLFDCYRLGIPYLASRRPLIEKVHADYMQAGCFCDFTDKESIAAGVKRVIALKTLECSRKMISLYLGKYNYSIMAERLSRFVTFESDEI